MAAWRTVRALTDIVMCRGPVSFIDPFGLSPIQALYANNNFDHIVLSLASCIPFVGYIPATINANLYAKEGDVTKQLMWECIAVIELLRGEKDLNTPAAENNIQPNLLRNWKKEFLDNASVVFDDKREENLKEKLTAKLYKAATLPDSSHSAGVL